ncbi:MAG: Rieske 2Fe-2S domain-containing protein [Cyclobacteriaceae bacterium]|nr:Rieske 2Fe-2S domain-containing protein [Cyclobacteriaceae bacterium]
MNWIKIFDSLDIAVKTVPHQSSKLLIIGGRKICLTNIKGEFFALDDKCPHRGASLSEGIVNYLGEVICPLHEYRFSSKTGCETDNKCGDAVVFKIKIEKEGLFIVI